MTNAPDSASIVGTYETSDTAGSRAPFTQIERTSPVFELARANDLAYALRSLDPADSEVSPNLVQTSPGLTVNRGDPQADADRVRAAADDVHRKLEAMGYVIDREHGTVTPRDFPATTHWMNAGASIGPPVVVEEQQDRSAG